MSVRRTAEARVVDGAAELKGRVVLVTGGARGLGRAVCEDLAAAGAFVIVTDVEADAASAHAEALRAAGFAASARRLDVRNEEDASAAIAAAIEAHGRLDALINNAGVDVTKPVTELSVGEWDHVLAVNLRGP
ncbi:MAG: SDR family NAD(P)-dependent oxidoreductase, partial [Gammaproteobacteria bacterium]